MNAEMEVLRAGSVSSRAWSTPDAPHALALLRARRERPSHRAAESGDELAPSKANAHQALSSATSADFVLIGVIFITPAGDEERSGPTTSCVSSPAL
jgi:hypothetical protein